MKLKKVAKICLIMVIAGYLARLALGYQYVLQSPVGHVFGSLETYSLIFFFYMVMKSSDE